MSDFHAGRDRRPGRDDGRRGRRRRPERDGHGDPGRRPVRGLAAAPAARAHRPRRPRRAVPAGHRHGRRARRPASGSTPSPRRRTASSSPASTSSSAARATSSAPRSPAGARSSSCCRCSSDEDLIAAGARRGERPGRRRPGAGRPPRPRRAGRRPRRRRAGRVPRQGMTGTRECVGASGATRDSRDAHRGRRRRAAGRRPGAGHPAHVRTGPGGAVQLAPGAASTSTARGCSTCSRAPARWGSRRCPAARPRPRSSSPTARPRDVLRRNVAAVGLAGADVRREQVERFLGRRRTSRTTSSSSTRRTPTPTTTSRRCSARSTDRWLAPEAVVVVERSGPRRRTAVADVGHTAARTALRRGRALVRSRPMSADAPKIAGPPGDLPGLVRSRDQRPPRHHRPRRAASTTRSSSRCSSTSRSPACSPSRSGASC